MNPETKAVKFLLKEIVYGDCRLKVLENLCSPNIDWERLNFILRYSELEAFLYVILKGKPSITPKRITDSLKDFYYSELFRYILLFQEFLQILKKAKENDILIIPIKGLSFSEEYYRRFGLRPLLDIDLLIKESELEKGVLLLENLGYKKLLLGATEEYWLNKQCHLEFIKNNENIPVLAELHWALDFKRYKNSAIIPNLWGRLRKTSSEGEDFFVLSPEDTLFSLALHQRRFGRVFNLKYVCDVGIILKEETLDWDYIFKTAFEEKIRASLYFLLFQAQFVLDIELNKYLTKLKIPYWQRFLIAEVTKKYAFSARNITNFPYIYILCHLLLYDNIIYPIKYILNIPQEQFAKFYSLPLYSKKTYKIYRIRFFYSIYRLAKDSLEKFFKKSSAVGFFLAGKA